MDSGRDDSNTRYEHGRRLFDSLIGDRDRVVVGVLLVTLLALLLRLALLGYRVAHWDEARVAYWILRYQETGAFAYRPIIHGPFVQHAARPLFALFGPSDFLGRLPVALAGGLVPLSALLFRKHLRGHETVILAFILAGNSILLYYSRFLRSDVLVGAFMLTALGFLVRTYDTREGRYLYPAAVFLGFGIASKENALIYILTWLGALALVVDTTLYRPRTAPSGARLVWNAVTDVVSRLRARDWRHLVFVGHLLGATLFLGLVWLVMFAPRGDAAGLQPWPASQDNLGTVMLGDALSNPWLLPDLVVNTGEYWLDRYPMWSDKALSTGENETLLDRYMKFAPDYFDVLKNYALPTMLFSLLGFLRERYAAVTSRNLVLFCSYAGFASVIGYPLGLDIFGPWNATHPVVVLAIPAAAGLGMVYRQARRAIRNDDAIESAIAGLLLMVIFGHLVLTGVSAAFVDDTNASRNDLIQYGQPADDMRYDIQQLNRFSAANNGTDVLVYGSYFVSGQPDSQFQPACMGPSGWFDGLPMPWYLYAADADVTCIESARNISTLDDDIPPVVLTRENSIEDIQAAVEGYEYSVYQIRTSGSETVLLFDERAIERAS